MLTGSLSYHSSVVKVPNLRRVPFTENPPRAQTPETKPPPDRGGKPAPSLPPKASSVLAVCLLDPCSRYSRYCVVSVTYSTTTRHPCQDQGMCFCDFLRPPAGWRRPTHYPCPANVPRLAFWATVAYPAEPSPSVAQPGKSITPIIGCQINEVAFTHHVPCRLGALQITPGLPPFAAQRGGNLPYLRRGVKFGIRGLKTTST
jgi:hypothetical protein